MFQTKEYIFEHVISNLNKYKKRKCYAKKFTFVRITFFYFLNPYLM